MIIYGGIPDKIIYVLRPTEEVTRGWYGLEDLHFADAVSVMPAFPVDPDSRSAMDTATRWAGGGVTRSVETHNQHIKEVEVITIEARAEGGRAYKVRLRGIEDDELYVDMREDVVLDAMLVNGVKKGGIIPGPFIWGRLQSQLRLVRVGSTLHKAMREAVSRAAEKPLGPKQWVVGGIYLTRKLDALMYMGAIDTDIVEYEPRTERGVTYPTYTIRTREIRNVPHWFELKHHGRYKRVEARAPEKAQYWRDAWEEGYEPEHCWVFGLQPTKHPTVIRHITTVEIDWPRLQKAALGHALREATMKYYYPGSNRERDAYEQFMHASALAHARPAGQPKPEHEWKPEFPQLKSR